ncbi:hypothetical protein EGT74_02675 [Chitinophaga lutea]|uniref:Uncharacterized protein n=2 Tax=Chitinophaga lutea TaxID=2488634 RepID=A0A3N4PYI8_9BACT|nr:hypothetical protein EGT74_02675 [Chitinophaga lutea]
MLLGALLFFSYSNSLKAQVKIGGNPAVVDPNAILELESTRKGLLLPRLTDAGFQLLNASPTIANGLLIYLSQPSGALQPGFYVRQNNQWQLIDASGGASSPWRINGNGFPAGQSPWLGTSSANPFTIRTNNLPRLGIDENGVFNFTGTGYSFAGVGAAAPTDNDVLVINASGQIFKKDLSLVSVTSLNGLSGALNLDISAATHAQAAFTTTAGSPVISLELPIMQDHTTQQYGFITAADYEKLKNLTAANAFTFADFVADDALANNGGKFEWTGTQWELRLNEAGENRAGIVTTGAQTFAGDKVFKGNVTLGSASSQLNINGPVMFNSLVDIDAAATEYNVLLSNSGKLLRSVTVPKWKFGGTGISGISIVDGATTHPAVAGTTADGTLTFEMVKTGTDFAITPGTNKITFDMPDASATADGLITKDAQEIGGTKTFKGEIVANGASNALKVDGGLKIKHRALDASGNVLESDYVLLVKGNNGSPEVPVTLQPAASNSGRVYVFTRLPQSGVSSDDESTSVVRIRDAGTIVAEISEPYTSITILSDGTKWIVVSRSMGGI